LVENARLYDAMSTQRHVIKRQLIELNIQHSAEAQRWQDEVSRIYRGRIVPLIDQLCTELSEPDRLYQIETLDLDLGVLNPEQLETEFVAKVNAALRQALVAQVHAQTDEPDRPAENHKVTSQMELFAHFARTGSLPWWADATQPGLLEECLQNLLYAVPESLQRLMRALAQEPVSLRRLVAHYADESLALLAELFVPSLKASFDDLRTLLEVLQRSEVAANRRPAQLRWSVWASLLYVASMSGVQITALEQLYQAVLHRVAAELGVTLPTLLAALDPMLAKNQTTISPELYQALISLQQASRPPEASNAETLAEVLAQWLTAGGSLADLPAIKKQLEAAGLSLAETTELTRLLGGQLPAAMLSRSSEPSSPPAGSFSDTDELYIDNAGLVILWPFLEHFFARLDLLEDKQFRDDAARHRAVGLLQYLVTANIHFPEYHLPLNKVLCGMELTEVFDAGPPLSAAETEECSNLLTAVIQHAPILRSMSIRGFQGTFLLRQGVLRTRDGAWLLQVEKEMHDIVLERFPWSWAWVKLPWMDGPLRVEWV
jgi:hypothetical protein